jgi:hypothetical protein
VLRGWVGISGATGQQHSREDAAGAPRSRTIGRARLDDGVQLPDELQQFEVVEPQAARL